MEEDEPPREVLLLCGEVDFFLKDFGKFQCPSAERPNCNSIHGAVVMDHAAGHTAADLKACIVLPNSDSILSRVSCTHSEDVKTSDFR